MKPLLLTIALLFSTPVWAEKPKQVTMQCPTGNTYNTYKFTKGLFDADRWFADLDKHLNSKQAEISSRILKEIRDRLKFLFDSIEWRKEAEWVKWPQKNGQLYASEISSQTRILDYGGQTTDSHKVTSTKYWDKYATLNGEEELFPIRTVIKSTTTIDFVLFTRKTFVKLTAPNGYSKTFENTFRCRDIKK